MQEGRATRLARTDSASECSGACAFNSCPSYYILGLLACLTYSRDDVRLRFVAPNAKSSIHRRSIRATMGKPNQRNCHLKENNGLVRAAWHRVSGVESCERCGRICVLHFVQQVSVILLLSASVRNSVIPTYVSYIHLYKNTYSANTFYSKAISRKHFSLKNLYPANNYFYPKHLYRKHLSHTHSKRRPGGLRPPAKKK
jgi:hypothetical protein